MPPEFDTRHNARAISRWSQPGFSRVTFPACTDAQQYQRKLERIFTAHWCYVGLEVEIPNIGDYKLSHVGERQVLMVRDRVAPKNRATDSGIRVVENRCAHRVSAFAGHPRQCPQLCLPRSPVALQTQR